jgi:putative protease
MAKRQKAKRKIGARRKKVTRAARSKATKARKKPAKKTVARRPSPKKAAPTALVKTKPASPVAPTPPAPPGKRIGVVTHYYSHLSVATVRLEPGTTLRIGDVIHVQGHTTDFSQKVESLEVDHTSVAEVGSNDDFGLKVGEHVREHDVVYSVRP